MIKNIALLARKDGASASDFARHWVDIHVPMSHAVPGLRGYTLSHILALRKRDDVPEIALSRPIDGIAQTWVESAEARLAMNASPITKAWYADGAEFIGYFKAFATEEKIVIPPQRSGAAMVKQLSLLVRRADVTREQFIRHWVAIHAPMAHAVPGLRGYVQSHIVDEPVRGDVAQLFLGVTIDGFAETWYDSEEARLETAASIEARQWYEDGARFIGQSLSFVTREQVVIEPPA